MVKFEKKSKEQKRKRENERTKSVALNIDWGLCALSVMDGLFFS